MYIYCGFTDGKYGYVEMLLRWVAAAPKRQTSPVHSACIAVSSGGLMRTNRGSARDDQPSPLHPHAVPPVGLTSDLRCVHSPTNAASVTCKCDENDQAKTDYLLNGLKASVC